ncbi:hypothetical protein M3Y94_01076400 [Aphelenchoides besseyi]|nr:hypothetical protein M3Y94_01076400 [Aphelenchoides besseyi]KAI6218753.1 Protein roadkill [Aphelenchoides besseyi]
MATLSEQSSDRAVSYRWKIDDFESKSSAAVQGDSWSSDIYTLPTAGAAKFCLVFFPRGLRPNGSCALNFFLVNMGGESAVEMDSEFWLENSEGAIIGKKVSTLILKQIGDRGWPDYVKLEALREFAKNDSITICCRVRCHSVDGMESNEQQPKVSSLTVDLTQQSTVYRQKMENFIDRATRASAAEEWKTNEFALNGNPEAKLLLTIFPRGRSTVVSEVCGIFLNMREVADGQEVPLKFSIWFENTCGNRAQMMETSFIFSSKSSGWGWSSYLKLDELRTFASDGSVIVCCKITHMDELKPDVKQQLKPAAMVSEDNSLREKLWTMHLDGKCNDLDINFGVKSFEVSKAVMAAESTFFADQLSDQKTEIDVPSDKQLDEKTAGELIEFIYRGRLENFDERAEVLFAAAIQFEVESLKKSCLESLKRTFSSENVAARLILAVKHDDSELIDFALNFVKRSAENYKLVMSSTEMEDLLHSNVALMQRVYLVLKC